MGTGITDVIGGPHDFRSDRSDEFQKRYKNGGILRVGQLYKSCQYFYTCIYNDDVILQKSSRDGSHM